MQDRSVTAEVLLTPLYSSFIGRARSGELLSVDPDQRASAWASWAVESVTRMSGVTDRSYIALVLDGKFYDPKGTGPQIRPHLEVPSWYLERSDPEFPDRLALMGNGLCFPWWVISEVTAVRRALFNTPNTSIADVIKVLNDSAVPLRASLENLMKAIANNWYILEALLVEASEELASDAAGAFSTEEVAEYFPTGAGLHLEVTYDAKLRERNQSRSARRVGVWQLSGISSVGEKFSLGVVTPRLTANSLFKDVLFDPITESPAALLVRGLLLSRVARKYLDAARVAAVAAPPVDPEEGPRVFLRTIVAQRGKKLPEASLLAAVNFLQTYSDADEAWAALEGHAKRGRIILTTTKDLFSSAHRNALRFLRRAEDPEREDINVILPLGWDEENRVVRFTFSLPKRDEE
jgi:hypothetical protein